MTQLRHKHFIQEVHCVLVEIVSAAANATLVLEDTLHSRERYGFKNEAKKMVVALVDMERAFVPQHFIRLVQRRMERQRREEELKTQSSKKGQEAEQATLNRATSPQIGGQQTGGSLKSMKEKPGQTEKEVQENSGLKTAGPEGEITAVIHYFLFMVAASYYHYLNFLGYDDFLELALQFGMIMMFACAFPLAFAFATLNNITEIKTDALKLLTMFKRPIPRAATTIGAWLNIFQEYARSDNITK